MKFGAMPLEQAEGAFLAHGVRAGDVSFKKGRVLTADDIETLGSLGIETVIACLLEPGDVAEDVAAARIAALSTGHHVETERPFTGRVNLRAESDGMLILDPVRVDLLNQVDEAITMATLPNMARVRKGQMVATVKIIPFAVDQAKLDLAFSILGNAGSPEDDALLEIAPFKPLDVALIQTRLPGVKESVLDKTVGVTSARLSGLSGRLISESRCPHDITALADKLRAVQGDLILIAGASAITDRRDVLPMAIEQSGGTIEHFGMPVDPGNLLLLGHLGERPVLGLPGCARSPKMNGFDWVLHRLFADIAITSADIMGMGVGGLLTEIPSRPQPRDRKRGLDERRVVGILLAAGQSTRMGPANKLLAKIDGQAMVVYVVDAMLGSKVDEVILVTGHEADLVVEALGERPLTIVHNPDYAQGLSTSLRRALDALDDDVTGLLVGLGDMPRIRSSDINRLIAAFNPIEGRSICVPVVNGKRGNPVLFSTDYIEEMRMIEGDVGARHLIGVHAEHVCEIEMDDDATLIDVDTQEALAALKE